MRVALIHQNEMLLKMIYTSNRIFFSPFIYALKVSLCKVTQSKASANYNLQESDAALSTDKNSYGGCSGISLKCCGGSSSAAERSDWPADRVRSYLYYPIKKT